MIETETSHTIDLNILYEMIGMLAPQRCILLPDTAGHIQNQITRTKAYPLNAKLDLPLNFVICRPHYCPFFPLRVTALGQENDVFY
ncbi:hypothetical protein C1J03_13560 [Sulfitobacter sp. SK012]|nr:hypothetical protein C1J03_13560 [Sulfitobacter sp. SK012]